MGIWLDDGDAGMFTTLELLERDFSWKKCHMSVLGLVLLDIMAMTWQRKHAMKSRDEPNVGISIQLSEQD